MERFIIAAAAALALACLGALPCRAQGRLSEKAVVAQTVASTAITVEYYRPVARGRTPIGERGVVKWDEHWTPGANWATTIDVDHDVKVEGQPLPKGRYSIWTRPGRDTWTVSFHRRWHVFHMARPDSTDEQLHVSVRPDSGAWTEILTFDFPELAAGATTLRLRWGTTSLPIHLGIIAPPLTMLASRAERARYAGRYDLEILPIAATTSRRLLVDIADVSDTLRWRDASGPESQRRDFVLSPAGPEDQLTRARRAPDGQYWTESGILIVFAMSQGRAEGFEVHLDDGTVVSHATRVH